MNKHSTKSSKRSTKSSKRKQSTKSSTIKRAKNSKGGKTDNIASPSISYNNQAPITLKCSKCNAGSFVVKTLTMGTKTKAFFKLEVLDNRFKVFTCKTCGFVEIFSNNILCDSKECDPIF
jgi:predicted nucleic-acid-binding Zn-ribbon protein